MARAMTAKRNQMMIDNRMEYTEHNYAEIETALIRLGATAKEAEALTDILHQEGWGGAEGEITDIVLASKIEWLREFRPVQLS